MQESPGGPATATTAPPPFRPTTAAGVRSRRKERIRLGGIASPNDFPEQIEVACGVGGGGTNTNAVDDGGGRPAGPALEATDVADPTTSGEHQPALSSSAAYYADRIRNSDRYWATASVGLHTSHKTGTYLMHCLQRILETSTTTTSDRNRSSPITALHTYHEVVAEGASIAGLRNVEFDTDEQFLKQAGMTEAEVAAVGQQHRVGATRSGFVVRSRFDVSPHDHLQAGNFSTPKWIQHTPAPPWQVNMIRSPFEIVVSGYLYHRSRAEAWWTGLPIASAKTQGSQGDAPHGLGFTASAGAYMLQVVSHAVASWNRWVEGGGLFRFSPQAWGVDADAEDPMPRGEASGPKSEHLDLIRDQVSYAEALQFWPLGAWQGLLVEALLNLARNIPLMLSAARGCQQINSSPSGRNGASEGDGGIAKTTTSAGLLGAAGRGGESFIAFPCRCKNVFLSDVTGLKNLSRAFSDVLAPAFGLVKSGTDSRKDLHPTASSVDVPRIAERFASHCGIKESSDYASHATRKDVSKEARRAMVGAVRILDEALLGGQLRAVEDELQRLHASL